MQSMTIFTFGKQTEQNKIINEEITDTVVKSVENEDTDNILCFIFKGGKLGSAYYNDRDKMVNKLDHYSSLYFIILHNIALFTHIIN